MRIRNLELNIGQIQWAAHRHLHLVNLAILPPLPHFLRSKPKGEIVAAFGVCHSPHLLTRPPDEVPEQSEASIGAMRQLGKLLDETKPDVIIFLGSDHLDTFSVTFVPTFAIICGERVIADHIGHHYDLPNHREMAEVPVGAPEGAVDENSTYLHLVVCYLEYQAMRELLGEFKSRQIMEFWATDHYTWIYRTVLEKPREISTVLFKYKLLPITPH